MSWRYDCTEPDGRQDAIAAAVTAVRRGELVVFPTDTVYGIGADAFSPSAVASLLAAKGRGRDMPVPVLIGSWRTARALTDSLPKVAEDLIAAFWPGALTLVVKQGEGLGWDLGDTQGTVAIRMPLHPVAIDLLTETGPMAVSSANLTGHAPPETVDEAQEQLGVAVAVYLDGGPSAGQTASTIVDVTGEQPRVLREGSIGLDELREVVGDDLG
jgi:L-threonylcarbamoyladenylate synthase